MILFLCLPAALLGACLVAGSAIDYAKGEPHKAAGKLGLALIGCAVLAARFL